MKLQQSEESVSAMQAEAAAAKAKLREMELARMSAIQVALGLNLFFTFIL